MKTTSQKAAFAILCLVPFFAVGLASARPLRQTGYYTLIGIVSFLVIAVSAWFAGLNRIRSDVGNGRQRAIGGGLFLTPSALMTLLWVGLGTPWDATPGENVMRYEVLTVSSIAVTIGFLSLYRILQDTGERLFSTLMLGLGLLAGFAYVTWNCFQTGYWHVRVHTGGFTAAALEMNQILDVQLFFATLLTYIATAAAVISMAKARLLSKWASCCYLVISALAVTLLLLRGISFPNPNAIAAPWYETPGFIVGIPAMPWLMPFFLGIVLLIRSDNSGTKNT